MQEQKNIVSIFAEIQKQLQEYLLEPVYFRNNDLLESITKYADYIPAIRELAAADPKKIRELWKTNMEMHHTKTNTLLYEMIWKKDN